MLSKVYIVLDFDDDEQKQDVQDALKEISNMRIITGRQIQQGYPLFRKHRAELMELFRMITTGGVKSLLSIRGAQIIKQLTRR